MTPICTVCGFAVEWLRSCYKSEWKLFGDYSITSPGQYCFCPEGTPHYAGFHHLGSRNWTSDEFPGPFPLGELAGAKQLWHNGETPSPYPAAVAYGNTECFLDGEQGEAIGWSSLQNGYPTVCFLPPPAGTPVLPPQLPDITTRTIQRFIAEILVATYTDIGQAEVLAGVLMGNTSNTFSWPNTAGYIPGMVVAYNDRQTFVAVSGTTNVIQWALQVLYPGLGAVQYANYATSVVWRNSAVAINARIGGTGANPNNPLLICGHSYGGVGATLVAADWLNFAPTRRIDLLTFGMPRPASRSIHEILDRARQIHVANDNDPVPGLPPGLTEWPWMLNLISASLARQWASFHSVRGQRILYPDGSLIEDSTVTAALDQVLEMIARVLLNLPYDPGLGHTMTEYRDRLLL